MSINLHKAHSIEGDIEITPQYLAELAYSKHVFMLFCFIVVIFAGMLSTYAKQWRHYSECMEYANVFAGGMFIAITLGHILPEAVEEYEEWQTLTSSGINNLPYYLCIVGYALILLLDRVLFDQQHGHGHGSHCHGHTHHHPSHLDNEQNLGTLQEPLLEKNSHETSEMKQQRKLSTAYLLLIGLSFHSFFEGLAVGFMKHDLNALFYSIVLHKIAEITSIMIQLLKTNARFRELLFIVIGFSLITPLGTFFGMLLDNINSIYSVIFTSLAGGTFLFVACNEIINEEFSKQAGIWKRLSKFGCLIMGSVFIICFSLLE